jgi:hypothetical protein
MSQAAKNSRNRKQGNAGENLVKAELQRRGVALVERIETGWGIIRGATGRIVSAYPLSPVSGDFRGILAGGRSVLVEVKTIPERLPYSALELHQHVALKAHHEHGGLSLVAWVNGEEVTIFEYPNPAFKPRKSITVGDVQEWGLETKGTKEETK